MPPVHAAGRRHCPTPLLLAVLAPVLVGCREKEAEWPPDPERHKVYDSFSALMVDAEAGRIREFSRRDGGPHTGIFRQELEGGTSIPYLTFELNAPVSDEEWMELSRLGQVRMGTAVELKVRVFKITADLRVLLPTAVVLLVASTAVLLREPCWPHAAYSLAAASLLASTAVPVAIALMSYPIALRAALIIWRDRFALPMQAAGFVFTVGLAAAGVGGVGSIIKAVGRKRSAEVRAAEAGKR